MRRTLNRLPAGTEQPGAAHWGGEQAPDCRVRQTMAKLSKTARVFFETPLRLPLCGVLRHWNPGRRDSAREGIGSDAPTGAPCCL
jgi:hypothetical protein